MSDGRATQAERGALVGARATPLIIIGLFVGLTQVISGVALIHTQGPVQVALVVFIFAFSFFVAGSFFTILWTRNYVLFPPSEFSNVKDFVESMRGPKTTNNLTPEAINDLVKQSVMSAEMINLIAGNVQPEKDNDYNTPTKIAKEMSSRISEKITRDISNNFWNVEAVDSSGNAFCKFSIERSLHRTLQSLLDAIWSNMHDSGIQVPAYKYGKIWKLKRSSGEYIDSAGRNDNRVIDDIGLDAGEALYIEFIEPVTRRINAHRQL